MLAKFMASFKYVEMNFTPYIQLIKEYFDFQIEHKSLTLGEVLDGDRMAVGLYEINFKRKYFVKKVVPCWLCQESSSVSYGFVGE